MISSIPHPFPYQGSKRNIARYILPHIPEDTETLIEPFCGSAAITIAAAAQGRARHFLLNDIDEWLMNLWSCILGLPVELSDDYERLWYAQSDDRKAFFYQVREEFNTTHRPQHLLYLLARIVKGSVRYSADGHFNQSPDNRRSGMHPVRMRREVLAVSSLLSGRTTISCDDFRDIIPRATGRDVVYMDPPYQGTSFTRDHRYVRGLAFNDFVAVLVEMNRRRLSYIVSYDGRTGRKIHGKSLPNHLGLTQLSVPAGRSAQGTLLGANLQTVESLYLSPELVRRLSPSQIAPFQTTLGLGSSG